MSCAGGVCASAAPKGEELCIMHDGDIACPTGYTKKISTGDNAGTDTRKCGACTCTPGASCVSPTITLYEDTACKKAPFTLDVNGSCLPSEAGMAYSAYRYSGVAPGCAPSVPPLLEGGLAFVKPHTVCCEQRD
jgi:hypothetical protein